MSGHRHSPKREKPLNHDDDDDDDDDDDLCHSKVRYDTRNQELLMTNLLQSVG